MDGLLSGGFLHHSLFLHGSLESFSESCSFLGLLGKFELLSADLLGVLLDEVDANLVVDERNDHAVVERNQG